MRPDIHTQWPAELRLLIDLTRGQEDDALPQALSALTAHNDLDWRKITALAEHHRVAGLVAGNLMAHPSAKVPDAIRNYFAERLKAHALRSLALTRATIEVTAALRSAEIPSVLLKGQAVAQRYYRAPNARQSIDIDVLVAERDLSRARSVVAALGFAQSFPSFAVPPHCEDTLRVLACDVGYRRPSDGARLELHWRLQPNPYLLDWKFDVLQSLASEMCLADTRVLVLKPAPQLVYLMCHGAKHAWFRLKWIADVYRIVNALTEEQAREAIQLARCAGVMRMVAASSRLLADIYGVPAERFAGDHATSRQDRRLLEHIMRCIECPTTQHEFGITDLGQLLSNLRYEMNLRPEPRYKLAAALRFLADVRDIKTLRLSKRWLWLHVLLGPVLGAARVLKREIRSRWPST